MCLLQGIPCCTRSWKILIKTEDRELSLKSLQLDNIAQSQAKESKIIESQLLRFVTPNPGDFPLKQRFPLPASVSGALGEAWVPSAPRWPPHTTACPAKWEPWVRKAPFHGKRKGKGISWGTTALAAGRGFCSQANTGLVSGNMDFPSSPWMGQHLSLGKAEM